MTQNNSKIDFDSSNLMLTNGMAIADENSEFIMSPARLFNRRGSQESNTSSESTSMATALFSRRDSQDSNSSAMAVPLNVDAPEFVPKTTENKENTNTLPRDLNLSKNRKERQKWNPKYRSCDYCK